MLTYDDGDASRAVAVAASQNTAGRVAESSSQPEVVDDAKTSHRKRMNNVRVYALAEKYNIPVGKDLAKTKFTECKYAFEYSQYREVIDVVFGSTPVGSTPETDSGLRNVVIQTANLNNEKMLKEEGLAPAIRDRGDFGLGILKEFVKKHTSELEKQKQDSRTRAIELRLALGSLHDEAMHVHIPAKQDSLWRTLSVFVRLWEDFNRSF